MPTSRFWGYWEFINRYYENSNKTPEDIKRDKVEAIDWADEVKALKRKDKWHKKD